MCKNYRYLILMTSSERLKCSHSNLLYYAFKNLIDFRFVSESSRLFSKRCGDILPFVI